MIYAAAASGAAGAGNDSGRRHKSTIATGTQVGEHCCCWDYIGITFAVACRVLLHHSAV